MRILISNDDGIHAPGLSALVKSMQEIAEVIVMAPDRNRSASSHSLTLNRPLRVKQVDANVYSVDGTPTDCVHMALTGFLSPGVDLVLSGINEGANLGDDVLYSGTVAAAMEGRFLGLPAIALSLVGDNIQDYEAAAYIARQLVLQLRANLFPLQTILNVNVPPLPLEQIKGMELTRLGRRHAAEPTIRELDPRGRPIYWIGAPGAEADAGPGTDFHAITQGHVSLTPLNIDMTYYKAFDKLSSWVQEIPWPSE